MNLKALIEQNLTLTVLSILMTGFVAGFAANNTLGKFTEQPQLETRSEYLRSLASRINTDAKEILFLNAQIERMTSDHALLASEQVIARKERDEQIIICEKRNAELAQARKQLLAAESVRGAVEQSLNSNIAEIQALISKATDRRAIAELEHIKNLLTINRFVLAANSKQ